MSVSLVECDVFVCEYMQTYTIMFVCSCVHVFVYLVCVLSCAYACMCVNVSMRGTQPALT